MYRRLPLIAVDVCPTPTQAASALRGDMINESAAREWFLRLMHPHGPTCPGCGTRDFTDRQRISFDHNGRVRCSVCTRFFTNRTGTIFEGTTINWENLYLMLALVGIGWSIDRVAMCVGVHRDTVKRWVRKIEEGA